MEVVVVVDAGYIDEEHEIDEDAVDGEEVEVMIVVSHQRDLMH